MPDVFVAYRSPVAVPASYAAHRNLLTTSRDTLRVLCIPACRISSGRPRRLYLILSLIPAYSRAVTDPAYADDLADASLSVHIAATLLPCNTATVYIYCISVYRHCCR